MRRAPKILQRLKARIKHGVQRPDAQYEALRRHPPPPTPILKGPLEEITLPTDRLERAFRARREEEFGASPTVPLARPEEDPAAAFARRQWALMAGRDGLDEAAAFAAVEAEVAEEMENAAEEALRVARGEAPFPAASEARRAAFAAAHAEVPFDAWPEARKRDMDAWLMADVLGWDWEMERAADEELARVEMGAPEADARLGHAVAAARAAALGSFLDAGAAAEAFVLEAEAPKDDAFLSAFSALAARAEAKPLADWDTDEVAALDAFLSEVVVHAPDGLPSDVADPVMRKRLDAFPELDEAYHAAKAPPPPPSPSEEDDGDGGDDLDLERRLAPPPRPPFRVTTLSEPADIAKTLAKHGLYPKLDDDAVATVLQDGIEQEKNAHVVASIVSELKTPDSYSKRRAAAAKRAHVEQAFLDRIAKEPTHEAAPPAERP